MSAVQSPVTLVYGRMREKQGVKQEEEKITDETKMETRGEKNIKTKKRFK